MRWLLWNEVLSVLRNYLDEVQFRTWFKPLKVINEDTSSIEVAVPDTFFKSWIEEHYSPHIKSALERCNATNVAIIFSVRPDMFPQNQKAESQKNKTQVISGQPLNPKYKFETFVIGPSNRLAYAAAMAVAQNPAKAYNPLFIYGGVGLGKTHLMQAIAHYAIEHNPNINVCYISSEQFTNELIEAIQNRSTKQFRERYRNADILLIDDIQFIGGKESTQEEFFHTFNVLYDTHKQIIISSDRHPKEISTLEERLVSRFGWGLITDIQPPDLETRVAILKKKLENEQVSVPDEVVLFIAEQIKTNIRELEGALVRVIAFSIIEKKSPTLEFAKEILKDMISAVQKKITINDILQIVCEEFSITITDIKAKKRSKTYLFPRQIAIYLARELTDMSLPELGIAFGGKDHTTILHSYNKIKKLISENPNVRNTVDKLILKLEGGC